MARTRHMLHFSRIDTKQLIHRQGEGAFRVILPHFRSESQATETDPDRPTIQEQERPRSGNRSQTRTFPCSL